MMVEKKKVLSVNRKAHFNFEIVDSIEAGVVLNGAETKSAKMGHINLAGAYAIIKKDECWLINCHISPYPYDSMAANHDPTRTRKLLLHKHEIAKTSSRLMAKGLTLIPLEAYVTDKSRIKLALGLGRGKKGPDKREDIKKRDIDREMRGKYKYR